MKTTPIITGILFFFLGAIIQSERIVAETNHIPSSEIAVTFAGNYKEIVIQIQQLAQKEDHPSTWLDVGPVRSIQNWIDHESTTPGIDGRLAHFSPPKQIQREGYIFVLDASLGDPTITDGEQSRLLKSVPLAVPTGDPPEGYSWKGEVRQKALSQIVSWCQDWRYRRLKAVESD